MSGWLGYIRKLPTPLTRGGNITALIGYSDITIFSIEVYVLHAFQKKSKTGRETPRGDVELVKQRLREAEQIAEEREL